MMRAILIRIVDIAARHRLYLRRAVPSLRAMQRLMVRA